MRWHVRKPCLISRWEGSAWLSNRSIGIYCTPHVQLESDSYHIWFFLCIPHYLELLLVIFGECSIFAQHWGIQTISVTHLRNKYEAPPRHPTLIVLVSVLFLLYCPCLSFMKCVDVSSHYFFLVVIMDKLNINLMMLGMFDGFHSVQIHHNTELITFL